MSENESILPPVKKTVKKKKSPVKWHIVRSVVQSLFFVLFIFLLLRTQQQGTDFSFNVNHLFFNLDPLAGLSAMIAGREFIRGMALCFIILGMTLVLGRVWCNWICPMGTVLDWVPSRKSTRETKDIPSYWRQVKYLFLFLIIVMAIFGSLMLMFLDPITLLVRTLAGGILPLLNYLFTGLQSLLYSMDATGAAVTMDSWLRPWLINAQPFYLPNIILLVFFGIILALNAIRDRFWCRYLCPLGGLLALISRISIFKLKVDVNSCVSCARCSVACPTGAIDPEKNFNVNNPECVMCMNCVDRCNTGAYNFKPLSASASGTYDPSRRQFFYTIGAGILGAAMLKFVPQVLGKVKSLLRPPGSTDSTIESKCIRCGECVRVCPTGAIQPAASVAAWEDTWTPQLVMRQGYCDYSCNACGKICPSGAIQPLELEQKRQFIIGKAQIDESRCIPFVQGVECTVCEEVCPVPGKAIKLSLETVTNIYGVQSTVLIPRVQRGHCIGCGICETKCPVYGEAAIRVYTSDDTGQTGQGNGQQRRGNR
jgi:MauM/NapG family ferredoxin protein